MTRRSKTKYIHEGPYVAKVDVKLIEDETSWAPYLSVDDAFELDDVRDALRNGDLQPASRHARLYDL